MIERMLNESESAELRMLQAKAYGRDGGLSVAELERLQHLEFSRVDPLASAGSSADPVLSGDADPAQQNDPARQIDPAQQKRN